MKKFFLVLLILCALASTAIINNANVQTRGLDLGSPLNRPELYGINVDLRSDLKTIRDSGFKWIRVSLDLDQIDLAATDAFFKSASDNGLRAVAVLKVSPPIDPNRFASLVAEFAKRYGNRIDHYQILDEPNLISAWGANPNPAEYARILQAGYSAIKKTDPNSTVLLAALAPTIETGPKNISDILYLKQLYDLGAKDYFDAVAGKPYGFNYSPLDRTVDPNILNFSRLILLREEMLKNGDEKKFLWASEFGWSNQPSIWGNVTPEQQLQYTQLAYTRARDEWSWSAPLFLQLPTSTLRVQQGFALNLQSLNLQSLSAAPSGTYSPQLLITNYSSTFTGNWKFSDLGADIPQDGEATIKLDFIGDKLDVTLRRANYRAYLYVTIDGQPANALPRDLNNNAYVILTSPDLLPRTDTITLASGLSQGQHTAIIRADRGWDQWAIVSFTVGTNATRPDTRLPLMIIGVLALICVVSLLRPTRSPLIYLSDLAQWLTTIIVSILLWVSSGLTWSADFADSFRKYGDALPLIATLLTATIFYYSPFLILTILCAIILLLLFYFRPDIALAIIAFTIPFYLIPKNLWTLSFSMVEICTILAVTASTLRYAPKLISAFRIPHSAFPNLDLAVLAFVLIAGASIFVADIRGVAIREFRVIVIEPAMFYFLLRIVPLDRKSLWRVVDAFVLGAFIVALVGFVDYATGTRLITAEGGLMRMMSVTGSPNNLGLFMGRVLPSVAAIALMGRYRPRRILYAITVPLILGAAVLSFSKGALILGVPVSIAVVILFWGGRRAVIGLAGLAAAGVVAAIPLSQNPRFADTFNFTSGTSFFRIQLWRSVVSMIADHPWLGVGLDNFLYAYRGKYILPEAWQEPNLAHAHNIILDSLARLGLFGFAATLWMLSAFFLNAYTTLKRLTDPDLRALAIGLVASMINCLAHGMVDTGYWFVDLAFVFMMTMGLMKKLESGD